MEQFFIRPDPLYLKDTPGLSTNPVNYLEIYQFLVMLSEPTGLRESYFGVIHVLFLKCQISIYLYTTLTRNMIKPDLHKPAWQWATLILLAFFWGSSFILMKKGLQSYSNGQVAAFRIFFSFLAFLPMGIPKLKKIHRGNIRSVLLVAIIGNTLPAFLFTKAQTQIDSSLAGILNSMAPLFTLIVGAIFYRSKAKALNVVGIFLGLAGAAGLIIVNAEADKLFDPGKMNIYGLFVVLATLCYGINANEIKYKIKDLKGLEITALSFTIAGPVGLVYLLFSDFSAVAEAENYLQNLGYVFLLAMFSSVAALSIFYTFLQYVHPLFATSVTYLIPVIAIFWGVMDGEALVPLQFLFIAAILVGVYLVTWKNNNKKSSTYETKQTINS